MLPKIDEVAISQAVRHFGAQHQIIKSLEELAELSADLSRHMQTPPKGYSINIVGEIADALIMCNQLAVIFGVANVQCRVNEKIERLNRLMGNKSGLQSQENQDG